MAFLTAPCRLLIMLTLSFWGSIGVDGLSLPRPMPTCTRSVGTKSCHDSRLWMTSSRPSIVLDDSDEDDVDLPKLKNQLTREFFSIGFPAFIQLAAEPLAALVVCDSFVPVVRMLNISNH